jgi:ribosomal protein S19
MSEIIDFKSETQADNQPMTDDEMRLANIYDVAVGLIIDIEEGRIFSMAEIKEQMIEVLEIIQEEFDV